MSNIPEIKQAFVLENAPKILIALIIKHTQMSGNIKSDDLIEYEREATSLAIIMFENIQLQTESQVQRIMRMASRVKDLLNENNNK